MTLIAHAKFAELTAADLMTADLVRLAEDTPLRVAAQLFVAKQISGAPVINPDGRCVGVLSTADFLRFVSKGGGADSRPSSVTCPYQQTREDRNGRRFTECSLPLGTCAIQGRETGEDGVERIICKQPESIFSTWQMVDFKDVPGDAVRNYMVADPVTVTADTGIRDLARKMIDGHIHRLIVVDDSSMPIGIVTSTDLIAALAYLDAE